MVDKRPWQDAPCPLCGPDSIWNNVAAHLAYFHKKTHDEIDKMGYTIPPPPILGSGTLLGELDYERAAQDNRAEDQLAVMRGVPCPYRWCSNPALPWRASGGFGYYWRCPSGHHGYVPAEELNILAAQEVHGEQRGHRNRRSNGKQRRGQARGTASYPGEGVGGAAGGDLTREEALAYFRELVGLP